MLRLNDENRLGQHKQSKVFLCHSSVDKQFVRRLARDLTSLGVSAWLDEWELLPGDSLFDKIGKAIDGTSFFCVVLSPDSDSSKWCKAELREALGKEMDGETKVIPLLYRDVRSPAFLRARVHIDFSRNYFVALTRLASLALAADWPKIVIRLAAKPPKSMKAVRDALAHGLEDNVLKIGKENYELLGKILRRDLSDRIAIIDLKTGIRTEAC